MARSSFRALMPVFVFCLFVPTLAVVAEAVLTTPRPAEDHPAAPVMPSDETLLPVNLGEAPASGLHDPEGGIKDSPLQETDAGMAASPDLAS